MAHYAFAERLALADSMAKVGPEAPTLSGNWTVRDLLAHLLLRERRPDASPGIVIKRLAARTRQVQESIAAGDFHDLLRLFRRPPWWSPLSNVLLDETVNLVEMFVHHEDVRRAQSGWSPRDLPVGLETALFRRVRWLARLSLRRFPAVIHLESPGFGAIRGGRGGVDVVTLSGRPGELMLYLYGRQAHALVEATGPQPVVGRLNRARLGI